MLKNFAKNVGFTLLEIIVAVAIFGVMASIIFPSLFQFLDMRERVDEKHHKISGLQKTFLFLSNDIRFAVNRLSKDEYGELAKTTLSIGDSIGSDYLIDFTASYPDLSLGGLNVPRRVRWQLEDGTLQRVQYPVMDPESGTRSTLQLLLEHVLSVDIELSHIQDGKDNTDDTWTEQTRLPDLIEIEIELEDDIKYRRVFSMLGTDNRTAIGATQAAQSLNTSGSEGSTEPNSTEELESSL